MKRVKYILISLGILIAFGGIAVDYLWPAASPGINLPQLLVIIAGLAISLTAVRARRVGGEEINRIAMPASKRAAVAIAISALTLLILEIVLILSGWSTYFPVEVSYDDVKLVDWWKCDDLGCRYHYETAMEACAANLISGRHCKVNRQGFADSDDFVTSADFAERTRIMVLGDSFTQGFSADIGNLYVEVLEASLPESVVWNLGIAATGTSQALATFREYAPRLKPTITVLGFFNNDFRDNVVPLHAAMLLEAYDGTVHRVRGIRFVDSWVNRSDLPIETFYAYAVHGSRPPRNDLERLIGLTRLGSLLLRLDDQLRRANDTSLLSYQKELTRGYLTDLRDAAMAQDGIFLALLIPSREDVDVSGVLYSSAIQLMEELDIPYMRLASTLHPVEDYAPDGHWNNSGHQKAGAILADCVNEFIASADISNCAHVTMPRN